MARLAIASLGEQQTLRNWVKGGVAVGLDPKRVRKNKFVCVCFDARARVFEAVINNHRQCAGHERQLGLYTSEGEPLIYSLISPISDAAGLSEIRMRKMIKSAREFFPNTEKVVLAHHWPCAAAKDVGLTFEASAVHLMMGRMRVEQEFILNDLGHIRIDAHIKMQIGQRQSGEQWDYELFSTYIHPEHFKTMLEADYPVYHEVYSAHEIMCKTRFHTPQQERLVANL